MTTRYRYQQPVNEDDFEEFCLVLLREAWNRPDLERYGHRGERQFGVDIIDQSGATPLVAVQCKHHAIDKTLPPGELKAEVKEALRFPEPIDEYYVLTTAKKGGEAQDTVRGINRLHRESDRFKVKLFTWDEIERLIDQSPAAKQFLGLDSSDSAVKAVQTVLAPYLTRVDSSASVANYAHADLDEVNAYLDRGDPQGADVLASRLRLRLWLDLSVGQRWRLCSLHADAKLRQNHLADATALLLEALTFAPDSERAVVNVIRALRMNDDSAGARQKAKEALERFPTSAAVHGALIELAETTDEAAAHLAAVPEDTCGSAEILISVASRHDLPQSEAAARQAVEKYPEEVSAWQVLGRWLLDNEFYKFSPVEPGPAEAPRRAGLEEAVEAFTKVMEIARRQGNRGVEADALTRRSAAYGQLGAWERAAKDTERALELAPASQHVLLDAARIAEARCDLEGAVRYLRRARAIAESAQVRFFLGIALWNRKGAGDQNEAIELLEQLACEDCPFAEPALEMAVEGYLLKGKAEVVAELVKRAASNVDVAAVLAHQSRLAKIMGDAEAAEQMATDAIVAVTDETSRDAKRLLAKNLMFLGRFGDALPILQQLAVPGTTDESGRRLVDCAMRVDRC